MQDREREESREQRAERRAGGARERARPREVRDR